MMGSSKIARHALTPSQIWRRESSGSCHEYLQTLAVFSLPDLSLLHSQISSNASSSKSQGERPWSSAGDEPWATTEAGQPDYGIEGNGEDRASGPG